MIGSLLRFVSDRIRDAYRAGGILGVLSAAFGGVVFVLFVPDWAGALEWCDPSSQNCQAYFVIGLFIGGLIGFGVRMMFVREVDKGASVANEFERPTNPSFDDKLAGNFEVGEGLKSSADPDFSDPRWVFGPPSDREDDSDT